MSNNEPELLAIPMLSGKRVDIYSGIARMAGKLWATRQRGPGTSGTAVVVIHPSSNFMGHYLLPALAPHGVDVIGANTRYIGNDSMLTMENCVLDIGAIIGHLRAEGYAKVVLVGNSGGAACPRSIRARPNLRRSPIPLPAIPSTSLERTCRRPTRSSNSWLILAGRWYSPNG